LERFRQIGRRAVVKQVHTLTILTDFFAAPA